MKYVLVAAALVATAAGAEAITGTLGVTAEVSQGCLLATQPIAFGVYDFDSPTPRNGTGQVQLACTAGTLPSVALDNGMNASGSQRRLFDGSGNYLNYDVFTPSTNSANADCAYTTRYPSAVPGYALSPATSLASRSFNLCGRIPPVQAAPDGAYSDTLTATITF